MEPSGAIIVTLYLEYKASVYKIIDFEKKYKVCKYGDNCTRQSNLYHGYHSNTSTDFAKTLQIRTQELRDKQIEQAKKFTDAFLEYSDTNYNKPISCSCTCTNTRI